MRILFTGADSFIAKELSKRFKISTKHKLILTTHSSLDLLNDKKVDKFFAKNKIDVVIHCASVGGRRNKVDKKNVMTDNIRMFNSLCRNQHRFDKCFLFGSGAETNREKDIHNYSENDFVDSDKPSGKDWYGLGKRYVADFVKVSQQDENDDKKFIILRLFGCFGSEERIDRFILGNIVNYLKRKPIIIHKNREMSFFYVGDLFRVVDFYIKNPGFEKLHPVMNMAYHNSGNLIYIDNYLEYLTRLINGLDNHKVDIIKEHEGMDLCYSGVSNVLCELPISFVGLREGIKRVYIQIS